jgi:hypothetical protein
MPNAAHTLAPKISPFLWEGREWSVTGYEKRYDRLQITTKKHGVTLS